MLTKNIVKKFRPIWKLKKPPIKFKRSIRIAPKHEFKISLNATFSGTIKILQRTKRIHKPDKYVKTLINSKIYSPRTSLFVHCMNIKI